MRGALQTFEHRSLSALQTEVQAIFHALKLLIRMHIYEAVLCSNSQSAIMMINEEQKSETEVHYWIVQIHELKQAFSSLTFVHIGRSQNERADILAKQVLQRSQSILWLSNFPSWLITMGQKAHCKCIHVCSCKF